VADTLTPRGRALDWGDTPHANQQQTLTLDQVLEMQEAGVDFQSHSWAHRDLPSLDPAECVRDLRDSRELLEELLGRAVPLLAYPRGRHDGRVREAAARAGYSHALALPDLPETPGPFAVPRVGIYRGNRVLALRLKCRPNYLRLRNPAREVVRRLRRR
jgi:peptidoglycan/xylan/chitin deacetylase (PgdA/CDA1 family)